MEGCAETRFRVFICPDGNMEKHSLQIGEIVLIAAPYEPIRAKLTPGKGMDIGAGKNETIETTIYGGITGVILDGRGRPFNMPTDPTQRIADLTKWSAAVNEYPELKV